ncbi:MAG TPA: hypothetical protein PK495_07935 [Bacteroidales bacterium]|nr:hypothetical protein [Bacteroidales bacterium]
MKTFFKTVTFAMLFILFVHCEPEEIPGKTIEDYRNKWVGTYECERSYSDTLVIIDVVAIDDSILHIEEKDLSRYDHGVRHDVIVNTDGNFKRVVDDNSSSSSRPYIDGYFNKNGIYIEYRTGSPNITVFISYEGKKL